MHPLISLQPGDKFVMELGSPASTLPPPQSKSTPRQTATSTIPPPSSSIIPDDDQIQVSDPTASTHS